MWSRGSRKASRGTEKELGHPILAFTIACVLPEAHCPLTVGLCERTRHSLSYYTASPTREQRKEPGCMRVRLRGGWGGEEKNYSMIYTSKPLEGYGHHAEYCGGIDWCGEEQECYHNNKGS